ncbi:MAG TPA: ABC transporter ATP-binding protein [Tepidisphaeraceae bacterium]|nr:ABC transporter ATP-binding protein [Tepidisphaeraceae bacterium]
MLLEAKNLDFSYGDRPVLRSVCLSVRAGEIVALLGPNGSGKTTLLRCLLGHLAATGAVNWEGITLSAWRRRDLAKAVAYLAQSPAWEPEQRVSDVLRMGRAPYLQAFGLESARDIDVIREVAGRLALTDLLDRPLDALSGGQRQRVFLGRCLIQEPRALLLDEPNTWLDLRNQVELGHLLVDLKRMQNLAILMASHDLNLAGQFADRLMILSQGSVAAVGPPAQVLRPELLEAAYGLPMERIERDNGRIYVFPGFTKRDELDVNDNG